MFIFSIPSFFTIKTMVRNRYYFVLKIVPPEVTSCSGRTANFILVMNVLMIGGIGCSEVKCLTLEKKLQV